MQFLQFLNKPILTFFEYIHGGISTVIPNPNYSWGIAIIVFTVIIRVILLPLNIKQTKSQIKMQEIQPKVQEIQTKYKGDPQKAQQEVMNLYKESGTSPLSGCLPILIQWPVFIAMFFAFNTANLNHASFLFIKDLEMAGNMKLLMAGNIGHLVLVILSGLTTYLSSALMMTKGNTPQNKQASTMNITMAFVMGWMSWNFKAALVVYWIVNNSIQMAQTVVMKKMGDNRKAQ